MHFLQRLDASHELEGVMTRVVSTSVTFEGTLLYQDTRSMIEQSKVGITRSTVDGALVLEYEDMFTGKRSKLYRSQCLCLGRREIPEIRRPQNVLVPEIRPIGDFEGESVMSTGGPSIGLLRTSTSGHAVVELTSSRIDSPPWCVGNQNSSNNDDGTHVIDSRAEGTSLNDLKHVGSRTFFLESTEVLMHILAMSESTLQSESNRFCSHKARNRVDNDLHLSQVLVLARTFRRRTSTNSPRSCNIKRTLDLSSAYMMFVFNSCCTGSVCSELWVERISGRSRDDRGEELQAVCVCGTPAIDLDSRMSLRGSHAAERSEVTQNGGEGTQGTQDPPLELCSTPKTICRHPIQNGTGTCSAF